MFAEHAPAIARYAQASPEGLRRVVDFVSLTIRMPFYRVPDDMKAVDRGETGPIWGMKRATFDWLKDNYVALYEGAMKDAQIDDAREREAALLYRFAGIPGIGLVKGGFIAQLAFGCGGCLDANNIERYNLNPLKLRGNRFKATKRPENKESLVHEYQTMLQQCGGTEHLWDSWCEYLAERNPERYESAEYVSALHCQTIGVC